MPKNIWLKQGGKDRFMAKTKIYVNKGDVFGRLTIIKELSPTKNRIRFVSAKCECGNIKAINLYDIIKHKTLSCGCLMRERVKETVGTHGLSNTPEYHVWWDMINRCYNKKTKHYASYGGRGIFVCEEWKIDFLKFLADVGCKPFKKAQLDRIDNNDGYYKENVRWTTTKENSKNKRNTNFYVVNNVVYESSEIAAKENNLTKDALIGRCKKGVNGYAIVKKYKSS